MLNRIVLIGRLTKDPELKYTPSGKAVCTFTLAVDRRFEKATDFINIIVWNKMGETCANYLSKGKLAAVDGELHLRSYETKDGRKATATEIVADQVRFLSPKEDGRAVEAEKAFIQGATAKSYDDGLPF